MHIHMKETPRLSRISVYNKKIFLAPTSHEATANILPYIIFIVAMGWSLAAILIFHRHHHHQLHSNVYARTE